MRSQAELGNDAENPEPEFRNSTVMDLYRNKIFLAPMSAHNDPAFIRLCLDFGADCAVSGLISCYGLNYKNKKTQNMIKELPDLDRVTVQLFGSDPRVMALGAGFAVELGAKSIDLNLGCPARKVLKSQAGAALAANPGLAREVMAAMRSAANVPMSVKLRLGADAGHINYMELALSARDLGFNAVTLHPRTAAMGYGGRTDWSHIRKLRQALDIPVIANGDIIDVDSARKVMEETGCDSIMVGRAAMERPWIFQELQWALRGKGEPPADRNMARLRISVAIRHLEMLADLYGPFGVRMARSRIAGYLKNMPDASIIRREINQIQDKDTVVERLLEYAETV